MVYKKTTYTIYLNHPYMHICINKGAMGTLYVLHCTHSLSALCVLISLRAILCEQVQPCLSAALLSTLPLSINGETRSALLIATGLHNGVYLYKKNKCGDTPLYYAVLSNKADCVSLLISGG